MPDKYKSIFHSALDISDEAARREFLDKACVENVDLRAQVESLLAAHKAAAQFMQPTEAQPMKEVGPKSGDLVGGYKLREMIGEGGMGVVFVAEQIEPVERKVALKVIKPGMDTKEVVARFQAERQALALMDHPNIAKVFDGGATETGHPFFVMELVRGIPLTKFCDESRLDTEARLRLFRTLCHAIQHAHRRGVIHRDIKPSNVLVSLHDEGPVVKVIDFGVAKAIHQRLTELSIYTRFQQVIGTPLYMSPEQAELSGLDIDTRTDVYSLGVLLYELLVGVTPFDRQTFAQATYDEMRRIIREEEPKRLSARITTLSHDDQYRLAEQRASSPARLRHQLRGELEWIVTKALEKDRSRRYESAGAFADDVERYLCKQPVAAVAPSAMYKLRKFVVRRKVFAATSMAIVLSLLLGIAGTTWQSLRARSNEVAALRNLYITEISNAKRDYDEFNMKRSYDLVSKYETAQGRTDFRGFEWRWLWKQFNSEAFRLVGHSAEVRAVRFSPDGTKLATGSTDGTVRLWDLRSQRELWQYRGGEHCNHVDFSSDGMKLLAAFYVPVKPDEAGIIWDIHKPSQPKKLTHLNASIGRFGPNGKSLFDWDGPALLDFEGRIVRQFKFGRARHLADDLSIAVTWDEIWNLERGELLARLPPSTGRVSPDWNSAAVSPIDHDIIVTGSVEGARVWNRRGELLGTLANTSGAPITAIDFSKNGDLVAVYRASGGIQVFEVSLDKPSLWREVRIIPAFAGSSMEFSPTVNDLLAVGGEEGFVQGYRVLRGANRDLYLDHKNTVATLRFSPDQRYLAVGMRRGELHLWDTQERKKVFQVERRADWSELSGDFFAKDQMSFSPHSNMLAYVGPQNTVSITDLAYGATHTCEKPPRSDSRPNQLRRYGCTQFTPDGKLLYAIVQIGKPPDLKAYIESWDLSGTTPRYLANMRRQIGETPFSNNLEISPDGNLLVVETHNVGANVYRLPQLELIHELDLDGESGALAIRFSRDGRYLAFGAFTPNVAKVWDTTTWRMKTTLHHPMPVTQVSWSEDGQRLATSDFGATTRLWDVQSGQVVATFRGAASEFSADGTFLAVGAMGSKYILRSGDLGRVILYRAPHLGLSADQESPSK